MATAYRMQGTGFIWGERQVSYGVGIRKMVRNHAYALPVQCPKHGYTQGSLIRARVRDRDRDRIVACVKDGPRVRVQVKVGKN